MVHCRPGVSSGPSRRRRIEPQTRLSWLIVFISNRTADESALQLKLTVRTKNTVHKEKNLLAKEKLYFAQKMPKNVQKISKIAKICPQIAQNLPKTIC